MSEIIDTKYDPVKIGLIIRKNRTEKLLAIKAISELTKMSYTKFYYLEKGHYKTIKHKDIEIICNALQISINEILNIHTMRDSDEDINLLTELELIDAFIKVNKPTIVKDRITRLLNQNLDENKYKNRLYRVLGDYHTRIEKYDIAISTYEKINFNHNQTKNVDLEILRSEISYINAIHKSNATELAINKYKNYIKHLELLEDQEEIAECKIIAHYNLTLIYLLRYQFNNAKSLAIKGNMFSKVIHLPHVHFDYLFSIILCYEENWVEAVSFITQFFSRVRTEGNSTILLNASSLLYYVVLNHPDKYNQLFEGISSEILNSIVPCNFDCKKNSFYHLVINEYIASLIQMKEFDMAKIYIHKMFDMNHYDDYTSYLTLKLSYCLDNNNDKYLRGLEDLMSKLSEQLGTYERSIITLAYIQEVASIPHVSTYHLGVIQRFIETDTGIHNKVNLIKIIPDLLN